MQEAAEKAYNTKAFAERDAYEEKIAAEDNANDEANKAQVADDEANYTTKVAENNNNNNSSTTAVETKSNINSTTTVETKTTPSETISTATEPIPAQQTTNVAPANVQPVTQIAQATPTGAATVPEIKDMISNGKTSNNTSTTLESATKADPAKMVSSVTSNFTPLKPIKIDDTSIKTETTSTAGKFVPPIAGASTAAVAGLGTKLYLDKKDKKDSKNEEKNDNKFFNDNIEPEEESELNFSSIEDIIKLLE